MTKKNKPTFFAIAGPTASGKSGFAMKIAEKFGADILSVDSMKVYKHMDIGTAKATTEEREQINIHGLDLLTPDNSFSTSQYIETAKNIIENTVKNNSPLILEGGTGLYFKALIDGLFEGPHADWDFRNALQKRADTEGTQILHDEMVQIDPEAGKKIHPNDLRRITRALEVFHLTGKPITQLQEECTIPHVNCDFVLAGLDRDRDDLYNRINERVCGMEEAGLVNEVLQLQEKFTLSREASQALGYKEIIQHLNGECSLEEAVDLTQRRTRSFSRKQRNWLNQFPSCQWHKVNAENEDQIAEQLMVLAQTVLE